MKRLKAPAAQKSRRSDCGMTAAQVQRQIAFSGTVLEDFVPPPAAENGMKSQGLPERRCGNGIILPVRNH